MNCYLNRVCGLKSTCLKINCLLFLMFLLVVNQPSLSWGASLTLRDAIQLGIKQSLGASIIEKQNESLMQKRAQLEEGKIKHVLTGRTGYSKNELLYPVLFIPAW